MEIAVDAVGPAITTDHITNSVMTYDSETMPNELDCTSYPLDIMAMRALYQTLIP